MYIAHWSLANVHISQLKTAHVYMLGAGGKNMTKCWLSEMNLVTGQFSSSWGWDWQIPINRNFLACLAAKILFHFTKNNTH